MLLESIWLRIIIAQVGLFFYKVKKIFYFLILVRAFLAVDSGVGLRQILALDSCAAFGFWDFEAFQARKY